MTTLPKPPATFNEFSETFPTLRKAWDLLGDAAKEGPLDDRTARLVKLGIAAAAAGARLELLIPRRSRRREQLRNGERGEPSLAEAGEDVGQRPGGDARAGVVQQHDRSR